MMESATQALRTDAERTVRESAAIIGFRRLLRHPRGRVGFAIVTILLLIAIIGPFFIPPESLQQDLNQALLGPSVDHWLGTDQSGRDYSARLIMGLRTSLAVAFLSTLFAMLLGVTSGMLAGYHRGLWEPALLRMLDIVLAVPNLVLALVIAALMGPGTAAVIVTLVARGFPSFARTAHATTRSLMTQEFVNSGIVLGARPSRIILHYLLPNVLATSFALLPILVGGGLLVAASLSFFGLGVQPPRAELGLLVSEGRRYMHFLPVLLWAPGVLLTLNNVGLSFLSDGLRIVLDPVQREVG